MSLHASLIRRLLKKPASIAELQQQAQVSLPTLRKALQELSNDNWVRVIGQAEASGGRPAMLFGLDDGHYLTLGVHLQLPGIRFITTNLLGHPLHTEHTYKDHVPDPETVLQDIERYITHIQQRYRQRQIIGVGIASPGFIDPAQGDIIAIGRAPNWHHFPIVQRLQSNLRLPVDIANDVDCMAFAEFHHSQSSFESNLVYVGFDEEVKCSMFLNGQLYKGSFGNAGLISADLLNLELPPSERQQILNLAGIHHLFEKRMTSLKPTERARYQWMAQISDHRERFLAILRHSDADYPLCQAITQALQKALALAIANTITSIQPDQVVLGGLLGGLPDHLQAQLENAIRQHLSPLFANHTDIQPARLTSANTAALGAAIHMLETRLNTLLMGPSKTDAP